MPSRPHGEGVRQQAGQALPDIDAIRDIIARQFASLDWAPGRDADWDGFARDFLPETASLYPAARPVRHQSVGGFIERMKSVQGSTLKTFRERFLGADIQVFGHVAVAMAACELTENESITSRGVEALLLVKDSGNWKIVSQAWDSASEERPVPERLLRPDGAS